MIQNCFCLTEFLEARHFKPLPVDESLQNQHDYIFKNNLGILFLLLHRIELERIAIDRIFKSHFNLVLNNPSNLLLTLSLATQKQTKEFNDCEYLDPNVEYWHHDEAQKSQR